MTRPRTIWLLLTLSFAVEAAVVSMVHRNTWFDLGPWAVAAAMSVVVLSVIRGYKP